MDNGENDDATANYAIACYNDQKAGNNDSATNNNSTDYRPMGE